MRLRPFTVFALLFTGVVLLAGGAPVRAGAGPAAKKPKRPKPTLTITHTAVFPPRDDAATSPCYHPGVEVFAPTGGIFHSRRLFDVEGHSWTFPFEMRHLSGVTYDGPMGQQWWSSLHAFLRPQENGDVTFFDTDGRPQVFVRDGQTYTSPIDCCALLEGIFKGKKAKLKGWTLTWPDRTVWNFDKSGVWKTLIRRDGQVVKFSRDKKSHALKSVKTPEKRAYKFKYGKDKRLLRITLPGKRRFDFTHDAVGNLVEIMRPARPGDVQRAAWTYEYDPQNRLQAVRNSAGELTAAIEYDGQGRAAAVKDFADNPATFTYDPNELHCTGRDGVLTTVTYDANGQFTDVVTNDGVRGASTISYEHDAQLRRTATIRPSGDRHDYTYSGSADPRESWNVITFTHTPSDFPVSDPAVTMYEYRPGTDQQTAEIRADGTRQDYVYDALGNLTSITMPGIKTESGPVRPTTRYEYDGLNRRTAIVHPTGHRHEFDWGRKKKEADRLLGERIDVGAGNDPSTLLPHVNRSIRYEYDKLGRTVRAIHAPGIEKRFEQDAWDSPVRIIDERGNQTLFSYDAVGRMVARETDFRDAGGDPVGTGTRLDTFTYDALGRLGTETTADAFGGSRTTSYEYDFGHAHPSRITNARGMVQDHVYDAFERPVRITSAVGTDEEGSETYTYDEFGNVAFHGNGANEGDLSEADGFGRQVLVTNPLGGTTGYTYDELDRRRTRVTQDEQGDDMSRERYFYDSAGNLTRVERDRFDPLDPGAGTVVEADETCYDLRGFPVVETDACGATTRYSYDGADRILSREEQPLDRRTEYDYDQIDRIAVRRVLHGVSGPSPVVDENTMEYDAAGNLVRTTHPDGSEQTFGYDTLGNGTVIDNADGRRTVHLYDAFDRVLSTTETTPSGSESSTTYLYDRTDNMVQQVTPTGVTRTWDYDSLDRLVAEQRNGATVAEYMYDEAGNIVERTNGSGQVVVQTFDLLERVTGRTTSGGGLQLLFWDGNNSLRQGTDTAPGKQLIMIVQSYDSLGNRLLDVQPGGQTGRSFGNCGTPATLSTPDGFEYDYTVDAAKRVTDLERDQTPFLTTTYKPGTKHPLVQTHPALTVTYGYDTAGNLVSVENDSTDAIGQDSLFTATYNSAGRMLTQTRDGGFGERWEYDEQGRLARHFTNSTDPSSASPAAFGRQTDYTYNASGLLTSVEVVENGPAGKGPNKVSVITYDPLQRPVTYDGMTLTYAGNGHATNWFENRPAYDAGERTVTLDPLHRVTEVRRTSNNTLVASFGYDVLNRPVVSSEEEFTGAAVLNRLRVFDGCRLLSEFSPVRMGGGDGFDLSYTLNPATNGHFASGFLDTFVDEYLLHTDCRGMPAHAYSPGRPQHQESYLKWTAQGIPLFEFPIDTPFRGAPSLSTVVNAPGYASSPACGLMFDWVGPPKDPHLPRPLDFPGKADPADGLPFPLPPGPPVGPGGGAPLVNQGGGGGALPDHEASDVDCEKAIRILEKTIENLEKLESAAFKCNQELLTILQMQKKHIGKIELVNEGIDEIVEAQANIQGKIAFLQSLDGSLDKVTDVVETAQDLVSLKKAAANFKKMGSGVKKLFGGATGSKADNAILEFAEGAIDQVVDQVSGAVVGKLLAEGGKLLDSTGLTSSELGLGKAGSVGYNIGSALNGLTGGKSLSDLLDSYAGQFKTGTESIAKLRESLRFLEKIERDRRLYKSQLASNVSGNCEVAKQQIEKLKRGWGVKDAAPFEKRLKEIKADLARQGMY